MGQGNAKGDLEIYRQGYPDLIECPEINDNYLFYSGQIPSVPEGDFIDQIHEKWWGNTQLLEVHHGYIQWLFPIRENGMNNKAKPLQLHEIQKIKADTVCMNRFVKSYELMLHFYGCKLTDRETGKIERHEEYHPQYRNLNTHGHNFLRITRILKSLGELGYEHYKKPFLEHFISEIWVHKTLISCAESCERYWVGTLKDDNHRKELEEKIALYTKQERTDRAERAERTIQRLSDSRSPNNSKENRMKNIWNNHHHHHQNSQTFSSTLVEDSDTDTDGEQLEMDEETKRGLKEQILANSEMDPLDESADGDDDASDDGNGDLHVEIDEEALVVGKEDE